MSLFSLCTHGLCTESRLSSKKHGSSRLIVRCPPRSHQLQVGKFSATLSPVYTTIRSVFFGLLFLLVSYQSSLFSKKLKLKTQTSASPSLIIFITSADVLWEQVGSISSHDVDHFTSSYVFSSLLLLSVLPPWFALLHCTVTVVVSPQGRFPLSHSPGPLGGTGRGRRLQLPPHWPLRSCLWP